MKKAYSSIRQILGIMLAAVLLFGCVACGRSTDPDSQWSSGYSDGAYDDFDDESIPDADSDTDVDEPSSGDNDPGSSVTRTSKKKKKKTTASKTTVATTVSGDSTTAPSTTAAPTTTRKKPVNPTNGYAQPQFFISTFKALPHSTGASLATYEKIVSVHKEAGVNLIENAIMSRAEGLQAAQACENVGVRYLIQNITGDWGYSGMGATFPASVKTDEQADTTVSFVVDEMAAKNPKYLEGYYTWDEVDKDPANLAKCKQINALFKKYDPTRLAFSLILPSYGQYKWVSTDGNWQHSNYAKYVDEYIETVNPDVLSFDYYPFQQHGGDRANLTDCVMWKDMGYFRTKSLETGKPFWFYFQAYNMGGDYTFTAPMREVQMYAAIAYGAKCLSYFTSLDVLCDNEGNKKATFDECKETNRKVQNLGDYLFKMESEELYHFGIKKSNQRLFSLDDVNNSALIANAPDKSIVGVFGDGTATKYVLVVNKDYNAAMTGELTLKSAKKISQYDYSAKKTVSVSGSAAKAALNIPAGGCALYVVG